MYITGTVTLSSTGFVTINLGFKPTWVRLTVGSKSGTSENYMHQSVGAADAVAQTCVSTFYDMYGGKTATSTSLIVDHYERVGSAVQSVLKASFASFVTTGVKLNVATPHSGYPIMLEAGN